MQNFTQDSNYRRRPLLGVSPALSLLILLAVDRLIHAWRDEALKQINLSCLSAGVMLTHDPKFDDPALKIVLSTEAFYIGALGSRVTQEQRRQRLLSASIREADLARLHGPVGIDLGGQTPEEIALVGLAEIVAARNRLPAVY